MEHYQWKDHPGIWIIKRDWQPDEPNLAWYNLCGEDLEQVKVLVLALLAQVRKETYEVEE